MVYLFCFVPCFRLLPRLFLCFIAQALHNTFQFLLCMCVAVFACVSMCVHVCAYMVTFVQVCACACTSVFACACICIFAGVHVCSMSYEGMR